METNICADKATLLISCKDNKGIVASVTEFIYKNEGNILYLDQHVDHHDGCFFMRAQWDLCNFKIPKEKIGEYFNTLIAERYKMTWKLHFANKNIRMAVFVSHMPHCLYDILSRVQGGEWNNVEIPLIISNHDKLKHIADEFGIPFHVIPITKENKDVQEAKELQLLKDNDIDLIVLARYMQVVSDSFINHYPNQIINIHHSFLPAFPGAKPYHSAYERGVKIIGATSHYVTPELDEGPIIAQGVADVNHKNTITDLIHKGKDLEKIVLSKAIWNHLERKTFVYKNKTIVFE
ncbi:MAG: formyltetrahydrofolate deformylase [Bacteroidales bacterium]|nr:formyltetrahydrofolate deformylase [Bacteroidales bacterium]